MAAQPKRAETDEERIKRYLQRLPWWLRALSKSEITNFLIMVFTGVLTLVAIAQGRLQKRLAEENADSIALAKQSADAASNVALATQSVATAARWSADAAASANEISRKASVLAERPWISVRAVRADRGVLSADMILVTLWVRYTNLGRTPALELSTHGHAYPRELDAREMVAQFLAEEPIPFGPILLPNEWREVGHQIMILRKGILAEEAAVYGTHLVLKGVVGAAYRSVVSDERFRSARSYLIFVKRVEEGKFGEEVIEFEEMTGDFA